MVERLHKCRKLIFYLLGWLELFVSALIVLGILLYLTSVPGLLSEIPQGGFNEYLSVLFDILIALELVKLLCRNDLFFGFDRVNRFLLELIADCFRFFDEFPFHVRVIVCKHRDGAQTENHHQSEKRCESALHGCDFHACFLLEFCGAVASLIGKW